MIRRLFVLPLTSLLIGTTCSGVLAADGDGGLLSARGPNPLVMPTAPMPNPEQVMTPPGENEYFYTRRDGQPYKLNVDSTNNLTDWLNHYYYNPHFRGEDWTPYPTYWIVERACHMMSLWDEYNQQNIFGVGNKWCKFLERYSGYGPGPPTSPMEK